MGTLELKKIISVHHDSINVLSFSHDGSLFASAGDDGLINIFRGHGSGQQIHQFQVKAPVTTLLWHSRFGHTILAGDASGDVHTLCLDVQCSANGTQRNSLYHVFNRVHGPVHCIAQSGVWLAIGSGKVVQLVKQGTLATWETVAWLPDPPKFPELEGELPDPMARSLHFLEDSGTVLLVTYLDHGVIAWDLTTYEINWRIRPRSCKIGCSAVSPDGKTLAATNLYDGIDWYSLGSNRSMDSSFKHTTVHPIPKNVILPVTFIYAGRAVLSGTSHGRARITDANNWNSIGMLAHEPEDIVQAVAYSHSRGVHQFVTGIAERGSSSVIRYWIQKPKSEVPVKRRPRVTRKMVLSTVAVALCLAIFAAFRNQRPQLLRDIESQPERWLQMTWNGVNNRRRVGQDVPAFQDWDDGDGPEDDMSMSWREKDTLLPSPFDRLDVGVNGGEL